MNPKQRFTTKEGLGIAFTAVGNPTKPALLFCHGLGASGLQFAGQIEAFKADFYVIIPDLRGHGDSDLPSNFSLVGYAHDISQLLQHLKIPKTIWVGNSLGGLVGIELLKIAPQKIKHLITFGTTYSLTTSKFLSTVLKYTYKYIGAWAAKMAIGTMAKTPEQKPLLKQIFGKNHNIALSSTLNDIAVYDYTEFLSNSDVPLTLIQCQDDKQINATLAASIAMLSTRKDANIVKLTNAGHLANIGSEIEFNQLLVTLISKYS